jgi:hypothetical protein
VAAVAGDVVIEGSAVLEKLAEIGKLDEFYEAVDADDVARAVALMKRARIDAATIADVVNKMQTGES